MEISVFKAYVDTIDRMSSEGIDILKGYISYLDNQSLKYKGNEDEKDDYHAFIMLIGIAQERLIIMLFDKISKIKELVLS